MARETVKQQNERSTVTVWLWPFICIEKFLLRSMRFGSTQFTDDAIECIPNSFVFIFFAEKITGVCTCKTGSGTKCI